MSSNSGHVGTLQSGTDTSMNIGKQQTQAAYNSAGSGPKQSAPPPPPQGENKFDKGLADLQKGAALGINVQKAVTLRSHGRHDMTKDIRLSIKKQYFTMTQVMQMLLWGIIIGMFIGALSVATTAPNAMMLTGTKTSPKIWSIAVISAGVSAAVMGRLTRPTIHKCSKEKKYKVPEEYKGNECLEDSDCTDQVKNPYGACRSPKLGTTSRYVQTAFPMTAIFFGVVLYLFSNPKNDEGDDIPPHTTDIVQSSIYGMFAGSMLMIIFSF